MYVGYIKHVNILGGLGCALDLFCHIRKIDYCGLSPHLIYNLKLY